MSSIVHVHGRQVLDSRGNPTVEVEIGLDSGAFGAAAVPSGRLHRRARGSRAARRRRGVGREGRRPGGRPRERRDRGSHPRARRARAAGARRSDDRARRDGDEGTSGCERHPRRLARGREGCRRRGGGAAVPLDRGDERARAARADAERDQRRRTRPELARLPGVHARAGGRGVLLGGAPHRCRDLSRAQGPAQGAGPVDGGRRRGRLRARARFGLRRLRGDSRGGRARRPPGARRDRARSGHERALPRRRLRARAPGRHARRGRHDRPLGRSRRPVPDRLDRGRARRERLVHLADADRPPRRPDPARRRRPLRHERRLPRPRDRGEGRATRSSSR